MVHEIFKGNLLYHLILKKFLNRSDVTVKDEVDESEFAHLPPFRDQENEVEKNSLTITNTRRKLRSCRLNSVEEPKPPRPVEEIKLETGNLSR